MDVFEEHSPSRCDAVGLDCETCVSRSAREIAACCGSLQGDGLTKIFASLYPSGGCSPMNGLFSIAYQAAVSIAPTIAEGFEREPMLPVEPRRKVAARAVSYESGYEAGRSHWPAARPAYA